MANQAHSLDEALSILINQLTPVKQKRAMREIASYLRKKNRYRIQQQENSDGSQYQKRKNKKVRKKMLTGFKRHIKQKVDYNQLEVGIFGNASRVAMVHDQGETEDGIKYPSRRLIGLPDEDKQEIRIILLRHITPHP